MSWYSPPLLSRKAGPSQQQVPIEAHRPPPETPESVRDLGVAVCYDLGAFRDLMRQYRLLDDGVTTRLNRALARSRSSGSTHSPSLLDTPSSSSPASSSSAARPSLPFSSSTAKDLGTSTYARISDDTCLEFWNELKGYWRGRQDVIRYCLAVVDSGVGPSGTSATAAGTLGTAGASHAGDSLLDADSAPVPTAALRSATASSSALNGTAGGGNRPIFTEWDMRESRAESKDEALRRQLHNEQTIDAIVRNRSLQAFKSRCSTFRLPGDANEEERRFWEGQ